ncbi:Reticulocyte-binding protein 2-like a, partial [Durusdinium trenchii]
EESLSQVLDQTLLLAQGLKAASARAATVAEGGWSAQDVEAIIHSYSDEPDVREDLAKLQEEHQGCLETGGLPCEMPNPWLSGDSGKDAEEVLSVLKDLRHRKASKLAELRVQSGALGPEILKCCHDAEEEFWAERCPNQQEIETARLSLGPAVVTLAADLDFKDRYSQLTRDNSQLQLPKRI